MRIALVPSLTIKTDGSYVPYLPIGLLSIMAVLKQRTVCEVDLIDLNLHLQRMAGPFSNACYEEAAESIVRLGYDLVGFSSLSSSFHHVVSLAKLLKQLDHRILTVVGGPGPCATPLAFRILRHFACIDYIVQGEGEVAFTDLVRSIQGGKRSIGIPGVLSRDGRGEVVQEQPAWITNLDDLPVPALESLEIKAYLYSHESDEAILRIEEGRGCPFKCAFCSTCVFWSRKTRHKSFRRLLVEMDSLHDVYAIDHFSLINDCFNADQKRVIEFCRELEHAGRPYAWGCSVRFDLMTNDLLDRLWSAGCRGLFTGIESGSERIQRLIGKNLDLSHVVKALEYAVRKGFHILTSFIIGFPEETEDDLRRTMALHKRCLDMGVAESQVNLLTPLHGARVLESNAYRLRFDGFRSYLANNIILSEHVPMILEHPKVFAAFYYFEPEFVDRREFVEVEILANLLANSYRQTQPEPSVSAQINRSQD